MSQGHTLGFIGAGNMAEAIARGAIDKGVLPAAKIMASDPSADRRGVFEAMGVRTVEENAQVIAESDQVVLAIKPQVLASMAGDLKQYGRDDQVLISIMAGIGSAKLCEVVGKPVRVIRVMPNTPMMAGLGMSGVALGEHAQAGDEELALKLFGAAGEVVRVEEKLMDAVTAVSGSGPAYVYYLAEAMQQAAQELDLDDARLFVTQTLLGAARMLSESSDTAAELRRKVTSPGGTTAAAIEHMESKNVRQAIVDAVKAAEARGRELGK